MDAKSANEEFHRAPNNILQAEEYVEMAFKGRKDYMLFTTKRILFVDNKTNLLGGKKVEYLTIPYFALSHFAIQTPGIFILFFIHIQTSSNTLGASEVTLGFGG